MHSAIQPERILLLKPCCIGDVVLATPLLTALRHAYPQSHITWGVGQHSAPAIHHHPLLDACLDTGPTATPARSPTGLLRLAWQLRQGRFDLAVVPDRSPLLGLAVQLAGIPWRAGLDSAGRGKFYNIRVPLQPHNIRHEAQIYLDIAGALNVTAEGLRAEIPVTPEQVSALPACLRTGRSLVVVHVGGGRNPGMTMLDKRPPISLLATMAARSAAHLHARIAILGASEDRPRADELHEALPGLDPISLVGILDLEQIAALASIATLVIAPDTGVMHLMAAAGAPTVAVFGPSDPRRYGPYGPEGRSVAAWRPYPLPAGGVAAGPPRGWTWETDGPTAAEVWEAARPLLDA